MNDVIGIPVVVHDACLNCGANTCLVGRGPAPLYRQLLCDGCECGRGYVSKELRDRLEKFVGEPDGYLVLRTGKVLKPGSVGGDAAIATEPKHKGKSMKMSDLFPSKYLRAADLDKPRVVTIDHVTHEDFKDDGAIVKKTIVHFKRNGTATAPLVCNKTNWRMLVEITGSDDDDGWAGARIELRSEKVRGLKGSLVDSVRVYPAPVAKKAKPVVVDYDDEIPV